MAREMLASFTAQGEEPTIQTLQASAAPDSSEGRAPANGMLIPGALHDQAHTQLDVLRRAGRATQRELLYRSLIRYWRVGHASLALLTLALVTWHIIYALQLLLH